MKNRLGREKSPYLLQHADNPVDWYPWGDEAFRRAEAEDRPVFLSIGYATCHWCHVMAHESFEAPDVAALLNETFVCIKVDREERPDIDKVYMTACQMMTGSGGWPLSIFMTPERQPFYAATYIPRESGWGRMGLIDLVPRIRQLWETRRQEVLSTAEELAAMIAKNAETTGGRGDTLSKALLDHAYGVLAASYDAEFGGFGPAPKFPVPHQLIFLLRYGRGKGESRAAEMAAATLKAMARGGMYDHIGFGFHRYSTDRRWLVPHFEKMLYDQALLALAYAEAYEATGNGDFRTIAHEILTYVERDMTSFEGGFMSAEDADSEGAEGKFYIWTEREIREVLTKDDADLAVLLYGIEEGGNFHDEATQAKTGGNILHLPESLDGVAARLNIAPEALAKKKETIRQALFSARERRVHPQKDDKILTDWNGLMIAALARCAQTLGEPRYLEAAGRAAAFVRTRLRDDKGRLLHRWREGETAGPANLDDYAFLIWGLLECYEASFDLFYLEEALALQTEQDRYFRDGHNGGYYFTPSDGERVIARQKDAYDGAIPSGNAVSMLNLVRLSRLTGDPAWEERAEETGKAFSGLISRAPSGFTLFLVALAWLFYDPREIVIAGTPGAPDTERLIGSVRSAYIPNKAVLLRPPDGAEQGCIARLAPFAEDMVMVDGKATAYVCTGRTCSPPVNDPETLLRLLGDGFVTQIS